MIQKSKQMNSYSKLKLTLTLFLALFPGLHSSKALLAQMNYKNEVNAANEKPDIPTQTDAVQPLEIQATLIESSPSEYFSLASSIAGPKTTPTTQATPQIQRIYPSEKVVGYAHPNFKHRRLIFEEPILERHGQTKPEWRQVISSGAKFFVTGTILPLATPFRRTYEFECSRY